MKRILCVDGKADICELVTTIPGQLNLNVIAGADLAAALHLLDQEQFSLSHLDSQLPDASGFSLCEEIRTMDQQTPIIIYSVMTDQADQDAGLLGGANAYLIEPEVNELIPTVKRLLE